MQNNSNRVKTVIHEIASCSSSPYHFTGRTWHRMDLGDSHRLPRHQRAEPLIALDEPDLFYIVNTNLRTKRLSKTLNVVN